jgi:signal transduction histidine kinase
MKTYSITRRLIATVLLIELASTICVTAVAFFYERHAHFRSFDVLLRGRADSLLGAVQDAEDVNDNVMLDGTEVSIPREDIYEVNDATGRVLGKSSNWAGSSSPILQDHHQGRDDRPRHEAADPDHETFFKAEINGNAYRVIRIDGLRIVDPGDKGGGIRRYVTIYYGSSVNRVWRAVMRVVSFYALSSLVVLAATGLLMSWLLNRGLAPLRELAAGASRVSVTAWDFSAPENARSSKELAPLVSALEELLLGLKRSFEQQRRFAGDAAHELKTSVAVVKSSLQLLQMKRRSAEEYEAGLARCLSDCERMEQIVAQMLMLARVEEHQTVSSPAFQTDACTNLGEVVEQLATMAEERGITVQFACAEPIPVAVDPELLKLLCLNLLMNALEHSPRGSVIDVQAARSQSAAEILIRDRGEGIAPEHLPYIFERFSRSDPSRSRKTGGTGLGLAICKGIAETFGGAIEVDSHINEGTLVVVRFPLTAELPEDNPIVVNSG